MAKDRNTIAKRQREAEKRRKADEKREKRTRRKSMTPEEIAAESAREAEKALTGGEEKVLGLFRKYLMAPGQMLCLNSNDVESMGESLEKMVSNGLLTPEEMKGGYALTRKGFEAMNEMKLQ